MTEALTFRLKSLSHSLLSLPGNNTKIKRILNKFLHVSRVLLTNLFSLFFVVLQNFLNSSSIFLGSFLTSSDSVAENLSIVLIQTEKYGF